MGITAKEVNELRQITGAGMMDCKKALVESEGNQEKAIEFLRKKGQKVSASRQDRFTSEGSVFVNVNGDGSEGLALSLQCETDFVAKNEAFLKLGKDIAELATANSSNSVEDIMNSDLDGRKVSDVLVDNMGKIGEKIEIGSYARISGEKVVPYIHAGSKLAVLIAINGGNGNAESLGKDLAMQIAAMNPIAVDESGVDPTTLENEMRLGREQAIAEGKPENIVDKIAEGKVNKFLKDNTLLGQAFVKDSSKKVSQLLKENNAEVSEFKRVAIG